MKQCPRCMRTYTDENLNFCLEDGELLASTSSASEQRFDDSPPTVMFDEVRRTNPTNWPNSSPSSASPPAAQWQQPASPAQQFAAYPATQSPNQTLALVSLGLGIGSMTIGWCCSLGLLLAPASLIVGFIALSKIKKEPDKYTGRGLAIGGMATASVFLAFYVLIMIIWGIAALSGGFN
jgi:hypothetical protein